MVGHGNRDADKPRTTNVSAHISDKRKGALNLMSIRTGKPVAKLVSAALEKAYGRELDELEGFLSSGGLQDSELSNEKVKK